MLTTFQLRVMFSLEFCISWKHRCVAQCRTRASDVIFPTFIYSSIYWTPCKQISDAWFPSSFPPPSLSHLPPCTIPLLMCHSNFGVQDVSSRKRMCFLCVAYLRNPSTPPLLRSHILSQLYFQRTYRRFPTVQSSPANLNSMVVFFFHILSFQQQYIPESHICNHSVENTAFFCFSCLFVSVGSFVRVFSLFMSAELRMQSTLHSSTKPFWLS